MLRVRKADGRLEKFDKQKVVRTCLKLRVGRSEAERIAEEVEREIYDGIPTSRILNLVYEKVRELRPSLRHAHDLRESIAMLRPKPDFEQYIRLVLESIGYRVEGNKILEGRCVDHEIDGVAVKGDETLLLEVKHHVNPHTPTGLDVFLRVYSTYLDLMEGYRLELQPYKFTSILVVCNTKISAHARRYAECMKIAHIGWRYPEGRALEDMIEEYKLYPITMIRGLNEEIIARLGDIGIVTLKQVIQQGENEISVRAGIPVEEVREIKEKARKILNL